MSTTRIARAAFGGGSLLALAFLAGCKDSTTVEPSATPGPTPSFLFAGCTSGCTDWDLAELAGVGTPQGPPTWYSFVSPKVITNGSLGSISAIGLSSFTGIGTKGMGLPANDEEKGLGLCFHTGAGGACEGTEVGEVVGAYSLLLDFTGLAAGTTVTGVTVSSLQTGESAKIYSSPDNSAFTLTATPVGAVGCAAINNCTADVPVPAGTKYVRFDPDLVDYLVRNVTTTTVPVSHGCTFTWGYWKTHAGTKHQPNAWPVSSLTLGTVTYTKSQLLSILNTSVTGNGLLSLAHQLIAAKLNVLTGASPAPAAIAAADALIGGLVVPPVGSGFLSTSLTSTLNDALDSWNTGTTGPGHCAE